MTNPIPTTHPYRGANWERDIYGMPAFPMLSVAGVDRVSEWYQSLGFADVFTMRDNAGKALLAHLRWCKWADILIARARTPVDEPRGRGIVLNFMTMSADDVADRARAMGAHIIEGPTDRPWNARDVTIADPEGHRLNFTGPIRSEGTRHVSFDALVAPSGF